MSDNKLVNYYRARAAEYEQIYYRDDQARQQELHDLAAQLAALTDGRTVLELACGTGYWTRIMSQTATSITATDIAPEMIAEARRKEFGCPVEFICADMHDPKLRRDDFDLLALGFWFSHQPKQDYRRFFDLIGSLVKPEGYIWLVDNNPPAESSVNESVRVDEHGNNFKLRRLDNGVEHTILKNYFSEAELREIFSERFKLNSLTYGKYYWSVVLDL